MEPGTTTVEIYGQKYTIRSNDDSDHVERVAAYVDERMREVASASSQVTSLRVAILAALNIADELFQERDSQSQGTADIADRARSLADALEATISGADASDAVSRNGGDGTMASDSEGDPEEGGAPDAASEDPPPST